MPKPQTGQIVHGSCRQYLVESVSQSSQADVATLGPSDQPLQARFCRGVGASGPFGQEPASGERFLTRRKPVRRPDPPETLPKDAPEVQNLVKVYDAAETAKRGMLHETEVK